jgi:hypothetical protein
LPVIIGGSRNRPKQAEIKTGIWPSLTKSTFRFEASAHGKFMLKISNAAFGKNVSKNVS